jgi:hypothetical protein
MRFKRLDSVAFTGEQRCDPHWIRDSTKASYRRSKAVGSTPYHVEPK